MNPNQKLSNGYALDEASLLPPEFQIDSDSDDDDSDSSIEDEGDDSSDSELQSSSSSNISNPLISGNSG